MHLPITSTLAALSGLIIVYLAFNVTKLRRTHKQAVGAIDTDEYNRKNGALTNFGSFTPIVLILLAIAESASFCWCALACIALIYLIARLTHIYSIYHYELKTKRYALRIISMVTTFLVIILLAGINLYLSYQEITLKLAGGIVNIAFGVINLYIKAFS